MDWYVWTLPVFYVALCIGIHIAYLQNRIETTEVILASLVGVLISMVWPLAVFGVTTFWLSRFIANKVVKYREAEGGR